MRKRNIKPYLFAVLLSALVVLSCKTNSKDKYNEENKILINPCSKNTDKIYNWISNSDELSQVGYSWHDKEMINTITSKDLEILVKRWFPNAKIFCSDRKYVIIDRHWFWAYFHEYVKNNLPYKNENNLRFDCDNISSYTMLVMSYLYSKSKLTPLNIDGIAIGEAYYIESNNGHSMNLVVTYSKKDGFGIFGYDMRLNEKKELDIKELKSSWFIRF